MYQRNARSRIERTAVRLGELRLDVGPHDAPDGTLTTCENVRPTGPPELPYYSPVVLPRSISSAMGTVCAIGRQVIDTTTKLIVVASDKVYLYDHTDAAATPSTLYTFSADDPTRKAQFAQVGTRTYIAVSSGADPGAPDILLVLDGTTCRRMYSPELPALWISAATDTAGAGVAGSGGVIGFRWAWKFRDGTIGPPSQPGFAAFSAPTNDGWVLTFSLAGWTSTDNPVDSSWWASEITGLVIYLSTPLDATAYLLRDGFVNLSYFKALVWENPSGWTVPSGSTIQYKGTDAEVLAGEALIDDNLWQHAIEAGAAFAYNQQLVLGDVQYDFRKPNAMASLVGVSKSYTAGDYAVRLMVTIKTNTGTYYRISDPVYIAAGPAATTQVRHLYSFVTAAWVDDYFWYPDARAVKMAVYVDHNNDGVFELLTGYDLDMVGSGNLSYGDAGGTIDLTGARSATVLPDVTTTNATRDHDPNRMLVSESFAPRDMPARLALYVSVSDSDPIMGFAANTVPVSDGQYGEAPLLVLNRRTVKGLILDPSNTVLFARAVPLAERGTVSRYGFTNGDGVVFFASDDGVWTLTPQQSAQPISRPVHAFEAAADILDELDFDTALAYIDDGRGHREVWVGTDSRTWAFSLEFGRWFTMNRRRSSFCRIGYELYGYDEAAGDIVEEVRHPNDGLDYDGRGTAANFQIVTRPMTLGAEPGQVRRIYRVGIRQRVGLDYLNWALYGPVGESDLTENVDLAVATARTIPAGGRLVAVDTLTVGAGGTVDVYGDTYIVGSTEGALVASGIIMVDPSQIHGQVQGLCRDVYAVLVGTGKMGQGIEAIEFDHEPRLSHRPRKRNF